MLAACRKRMYSVSNVQSIDAPNCINMCMQVIILGINRYQVLKIDPVDHLASMGESASVRQTMHTKLKVEVEIKADGLEGDWFLLCWQR